MTQNKDFKTPILGINHLAFATSDLDGTIRFWRDVMGLRIVATTGNRPDLYPYRHYFFEVGPGTTVAFFEWPGMVEYSKKPAGLPVRGAIHFDHLSLNVPDKTALLRLRMRLVDENIDVTGIVDHQFIQSIYFYDPNGIALEASYWNPDPTRLPEGQYDPYIFSDPDPVSALEEELKKN